MTSQHNTQITTQALKDFGFSQLEPNSFSNGRFDLILSDSGVAILYLQGQRSTNCIEDIHILKSILNYNIISSVGVSKCKMN
ncbi:MAG: hypothetical protein JWQ38_388 [Flavipsychrobacter sp.]|nr:hypothetical protein [Flavipsychrobacter sp.]